MKVQSISVVFGLLFIAVTVNSNIDDKCLACICQVESNCSPLECTWDVNSILCGYYQLKQGYWEDCDSPGDSFETCAAAKNCSEECVLNYMDLYAEKCTKDHEPTCEDYARIHNGGPMGCRRGSTKRYWERVSACYSKS
ncbi:unnamed protein product [Rotaria sp. Silwood2]|nr:unnamed protein product [Rotaria sp. Silwood2]